MISPIKNNSSANAYEPPLVDGVDVTLLFVALWGAFKMSLSPQHQDVEGEVLFYGGFAALVIHRFVKLFTDANEIAQRASKAAMNSLGK